jgi:hypothetical protein
MTYKTKITIEGLLKMLINPTETFQQLRPNTDRYWSWGVSTRINFMDKALILKVNGHLFKGYVVIALDYSDTYNVHLVTTHGNISKSIENVYCDELAEVIDNNIERIPEYKEGVTVMEIKVQTI